jgi:hypothetical protein
MSPAGVEVCDGLDNDCSGVAEDGILPPGTGLSLTAAKSGTDASITWSPVAGAQTYDAVEGSLGLLVSSTGDFTAATSACLANDAAATSATSTTVPAPGAGVWILARGSNCAGAGTWDEGSGSQAGSRDAEIGAAPGACP